MVINGGLQLSFVLSLTLGATGQVLMRNSWILSVIMVIYTLADCVSLGITPYLVQCRMI